MRQMGRAAASVCVLILLLTSGTSNGSSTQADVTIAPVGYQQVVGKPFAVRIRNNGEKRLTFCLGACGGIVVAGSERLAPGFGVQSRTRKKWSKEVLSCTPGDDAKSAILHGGEVLEFNVKVTQPGAFRLWLRYKDVSVEDVGAHCEAIRDGRAVQQASSDEFDVVAAPK